MGWHVYTYDVWKDRLRIQSHGHQVESMYIFGLVTQNSRLLLIYIHFPILPSLL